jgi:hypothetical protein
MRVKIKAVPRVIPSIRQLRHSKGAFGTTNFPLAGTSVVFVHVTLHPITNSHYSGHSLPILFFY